jgi:hypothetical protein
LFIFHQALKELEAANCRLDIRIQEEEEKAGQFILDR